MSVSLFSQCEVCLSRFSASFFPMVCICFHSLPAPVRLAFRRAIDLPLPEPLDVLPPAFHEKCPQFIVDELPPIQEWTYVAKGAFGKVYKCEINGKLTAIKTVQLKNEDASNMSLEHQADHTKKALADLEECFREFSLIQDVCLEYKEEERAAVRERLREACVFPEQFCVRGQAGSATQEFMMLLPFMGHAGLDDRIRDTCPFASETVRAKTGWHARQASKMNNRSRAVAMLSGSMANAVLPFLRRSKEGHALHETCDTIRAQVQQHPWRLCDCHSGHMEPLTDVDLTSVLCDVADCLKILHELGVVHRFVVRGALCVFVIFKLCALSFGNVHQSHGAHDHSLFVDATGISVRETCF